MTAKRKLGGQACNVLGLAAAALTAGEWSLLNPRFCLCCALFGTRPSCVIVINSGLKALKCGRGELVNYGNEQLGKG